VIHLQFLVTLFITSALFALVEIQIEGTAGWAGSLPTWKIDNRWTRLLMSGRPLTGYHAYLFPFMAIMVHTPFGLGLASWTLPAEARTLSFLILFWTLEDFLWFVFNPQFGLRGFRKEHIWWHAPSWWWIMPRDYWINLPLSLALYAYSYGRL